MRQLIFEVTEGLLVSDPDQAIARMRELAALGIRFSVDDFGTGYPNLAYLKRMPLYQFKIDRSFIRGTPNEVDGTAIVQSILALAGNGKPPMQGFLFSRPAPLDDILALLGDLETARAAA